MDNWVSLDKGPVSLHISYGTTYTNNLTAGDIRVRTSPNFTLFLNLERNFRARDRQSNTVSDAEELVRGGFDELEMVQLISDNVVERLGKLLHTIRRPPREWQLTISLGGERTFTVRPEPDQDRSSLFLHVLNPGQGQRTQASE